MNEDARYTNLMNKLSSIDTLLRLIYERLTLTDPVHWARGASPEDREP